LEAALGAEPVVCWIVCPEGAEFGADTLAADPADWPVVEPAACEPALPAEPDVS